MSEAETDDEIIEVNPGDYKIHNGVEKQMGQTVQMGQTGLLVPPPMRTNSRPNSRYDGAKAFMKLHLIAPSSSKFNLKRHQKDIEKTSKVDVFSMPFQNLLD